MKVYNVVEWCSMYVALLHPILKVCCEFELGTVRMTALHSCQLEGDDERGRGGTDTEEAL